MTKSLLDSIPEERVLFCIAPPFARFYKALPVELSEDGKTLYVVSTHKLEGIELEKLKEDTRREIVVRGQISPIEFEEAYQRFYSELLSHVK